MAIGAIYGAEKDRLNQSLPSICQSTTLCPIIEQP